MGVVHREVRSLAHNNEAKNNNTANNQEHGWSRDFFLSAPKLKCQTSCAWCLCSIFNQVRKLLNNVIAGSEEFKVASSARSLRRSFSRSVSCAIGTNNANLITIVFHSKCAHRAKRQLSYQFISLSEDVELRKSYVQSSTIHCAKPV